MVTQIFTNYCSKIADKKGWNNKESHYWVRTAILGNVALII